MLPEEVLEQLGDRGAALFQAFEQDLIADIARRIKKTGRYTETAELQAQAMMAEGVSPAEIQKEVMKILRADDDYQKEVAQNTLEWKKQVKAEIREMRRQAKEEGDNIIANAGDMSFNYDLSMWEQNGEKLTKDSAINRMISEMSKDTTGTFKNLTKSMGFKGAYSFVTLQNAYIRYLDKAVIKMASGTFSFDRAVEDAVREMAHSGLRSVDYASGRTYQLDTAARMCVRTSCHQLSAKLSMHNCEKMGTDLVEVTAHWGARPEHAIWQGKIYSRSGKNKKYPPFSECHYGAVNGLCGVNCRHTFYPFFEGISEPTKWDKEPDPKEYNGRTYKYYDMTQKQRQMERGIRATKREIEAQKAISGNVDALEAQKRKQIAEYHKFSKEMGIRPKDNRLRVIKGSSDLNNKQDLKQTRKNDTLKLKNKISDVNYKISNLKKQFSEACDGYSYDDWFKDFKSIEEGYGKQPTNDSVFDKLKILDRDIRSSSAKRLELLEQKEKRGQLDTGYKTQIPHDELDAFNAKALEQIKLDTGYSEKKAKEFQNAIKEYFGGDYGKILSGETETANVIRDGLDLMPVYDGSISRGMTLNSSDVKMFTNLKAGDELPRKGIIESWTSERGTAIAYGGISDYERSSVILGCENNQTAVGVQHLSSFGTVEAEVLSSSKYEVVEMIVENKYDYLAKHKEYLYFPEDLEDERDILKENVVCIIKVKEKS